MASTPTSSETVTSNIPAWAKNYATDLLGYGAALTFPKVNPATGKMESGFTPYGGELVADFSDLQKRAMGDISQMQVAPQLGQATGFTGLAALQAQDLAKYDPVAVKNYFTDVAPEKVGIDYSRISAPKRTSYQMQGPQNVAAPSLSQYQMGGPERIGAERFGLSAMQDYMSPYMQSVVKEQKRAAVQDYMRQLPGMSAAAARAGAKGGTREALLQAEAQRGLQERLGGIEATGLQSAYQQAAQQFGADRAAQMQAAMANQQAGLTTGQQNLAALLGVQQLGAGQSMQAQLANQSAQQQAQQQNLQAQIQQAQFAAQQAMQAGQANQAAQLQAQAQQLQQQQAINQMRQQGAQLGAQYGLAGSQLREQSRQFGAGLGLQGLEQQRLAAKQLADIGGQQFEQQKGILDAQMRTGQQQQNLTQQRLASNYQRFIDEQQYPYKQLDFFSNLLRGLPAGDTTRSLYTQGPNTAAQLYGLGGYFSNPTGG